MKNGVWREKAGELFFLRIIATVKNDILYTEMTYYAKIIVAVSQITYYTEICGGY